jgi:hypothetical protein
LRVQSNPQQNYEAFLKRISARLKPHGFTRKGNTLARTRYAIWQILNFQRSQKSTKEETLFTLNLGIASERLLTFLGAEVPPRRPPEIERGSVRLRINNLLPEADRNRDWWIVERETDPDWLAAEFGVYVEELILPSSKALARRSCA